MPLGWAGELGGDGVRVLLRGGSCDGSVMGPSMSSPLVGVEGACLLVPLGALVKYTTLARVPPIYFSPEREENRWHEHRHLKVNRSVLTSNAI